MTKKKRNLIIIFSSIILLVIFLISLLYVKKENYQLQGKEQNTKAVNPATEVTKSSTLDEVFSGVGRYQFNVALGSNTAYGGTKGFSYGAQYPNYICKPLFLPKYNTGYLTTKVDVGYKFLKFANSTTHTFDSSSFDMTKRVSTTIGGGGNSSQCELVQKSSNTTISKAYLVVSASTGIIASTERDYGTDTNYSIPRYPNILNAYPMTLIGPKGDTLKPTLTLFQDSSGTRATGYVDVTNFVKEQGYGNYIGKDIPYVDIRGILNENGEGYGPSVDKFASWKLIIIEENQDIDIRKLNLQLGGVLTGSKQTEPITASVEGSGIQVKNNDAKGQLLISAEGGDNKGSIKFDNNKLETRYVSESSKILRGVNNFFNKVTEVNGEIMNIEHYPITVTNEDNNESHDDHNTDFALYDIHSKESSYTNAKLTPGSSSTKLEISNGDNTTELLVNALGISSDITTPTYNTVITHKPSNGGTILQEGDNVDISLKVQNVSSEELLGLWEGYTIFDIDKDITLNDTTLKVYFNGKELSRISGDVNNPAQLGYQVIGNRIQIGFGNTSECKSKTGDYVEVIVTGKCTVEKEQYVNTSYTSGKLIGEDGVSYDVDLEKITSGKDTFKVEPNISVKVEKNWVDNEIQAQRRPETIVLQVKNGEEVVQNYELNVETENSHTFTGLRKYDKNGQEIKYTVNEVEKNQGDLKFYETTINGTTITNTFTRPEETIEITANKQWNDNGNIAGKRPSSVTLTVTGNGVTRTQEITVANKVENDESKWSYTFENLPKYDENGDEIVYTINEQDINSEFYTKSSVDQETNTVTNTFVVSDEKVSVTATKVWVDNETQAARRPGSIILIVKDGNREVARQEISTENVQDEDNNKWNYTFENLDKYDENGNEITYTVDELEKQANDLKFYEKSIVGTTITNTYKTPTDTTAVTVNKVWNDNEVQAQRRPETIVLQVKNGEEVVQNYELNVATENSHTFTNLPKYNENGQEIKYTVDEVEKTQGDLRFYEKAVTKVEDNQATIRNTYTTPKDTVEVTVNKVWNDNEVQAQRRPETIVLQVKNGEEVVQNYELNVATENSHTFTNLPKYNQNGEKITYTVDEVEKNQDDLKFYEKTIAGTTITNTYKTPEDTTKVKVNKVWVDNDIQKARRPASIVLQVKEADKVIEETVVNETDGWSCEFELPKYNENGQEIKYTVDERVLDGEEHKEDLKFYTKSISGTTITNTFTRPEDETEVKVTKIWNDNDNQAQKRPESVILQLKNKNTKVNEATVTVAEQVEGDNNTWEYTFTGLDKYDPNGQEIVYTADEAEVNSGDLQFYEKDISGTTLTNTFTQNTDKINVTAKKVWIDTDAQKDKRPESIMIILKRNGVAIDSKEVAVADNMEVTFEELPKYDQYNNIINYTVDESVVAGEKHKDDLKFYDKTINGTTITNTFTRPNDTISVTVNKEWVDKNNIYEKEPNTLTLKVINQVTGEEVVRKTIVVKTEDSATFTGLAKYDENGDEIIYTADEEEIYEGDLFNYEKEVGKLENVAGKIDQKQITITNTMVKVPGTVIVKYLDKATKQEISEKIETEGIVGEEFDVSKDKKDISGYTLVEEPTEKTGTYTEEEQVKTYYYARNTKVIVKYLEKGSNQVLANQEEINGYEGLGYSTTQKVIDGYTFVQSTNNTSGTMTRDEIETIYYYSPNTKVIAKYVDKATGEVITPQEQYEQSGYVGKEYTTEQKDIPGYTFIESTNNTSGIMTKDPQEATYYYAKNTKVIVNHLEKDTNEVLEDQEVIEGYEGKDYETKQANIPNYTFVETTGNTKGTMTKDVIVVNYYYAQNTKATIQHIDRETGSILKQETEDGKVGDLFETHPEDFENYVLVESPEEPNVVMTKEEQVVKYYYAHISAGLLEKHIDDITGELLDSKEHKGNEGDPYDIGPREIEGYDLVESKLPENSKGTMKQEVIEVKYYYIKKASVRVQYIDKLTGEKLTEDVIIEGHENDPYTSEQKDIKNYVFVENTGNTSGKMEVTKNEDGTYNAETIVTYYYIKKSAGVLEKHIDINTNKVLVQEKHEGKVGDSYDIVARDLDEYKLVETRLPQNAKGTMQEDLIEVDYYYIKEAKVKVEYIDKLTGEKLDINEIKGYEGDKYETEDKEFDGYDLVEIPNNKTGEMKDEDIVVKYYYDKKAKVVVQYLEKDTNVPVADKEEINGHIGEKYETQAKDIAYYKFVESTTNTEGKMTDGTIEVNYYYEKQIFNLKVDKWIAGVTLNGIPQGGQNINNKDEIYKIEIHRNKVETANVRITYKIRISNIGEIEGKVDKLTEVIPKGYSFYQEDNQIHWENNNGILITTDLKDETIQANEYKEIEITLRWNTSEDNLGEKDNVVILSQISNPAEYQDINKDDNRSRSSMVITVATGLDKNDRIVIIGIVQIVLAISMGLLVSYKKKEK